MTKLMKINDVATRFNLKLTEVDLSNEVVMTFPLNGDDDTMAIIAHINEVVSDAKVKVSDGIMTITFTNEPTKSDHVNYGEIQSRSFAPPHRQGTPIHLQSVGDEETVTLYEDGNLSITPNK